MADPLAGQSWWDRHLPVDPPRPVERQVVLDRLVEAEQRMAAGPSSRARQEWPPSSRWGPFCQLRCTAVPDTRRVRPGARGVPQHGWLGGWPAGLLTGKETVHSQLTKGRPRVQPVPEALDCGEVPEPNWAAQQPDLWPLLPPGALVVRFEQVSAQKVRKSIISGEALYRKRHLRLDVHVLSAFIDIEAPGETQDDLRRRLVTEALSVNAPINDGLVWLCRLQELGTKELRIIKDDVPNEPPHHYSLDFQERPSTERVEDFMSVFRTSKEEA